MGDGKDRNIAIDEGRCVRMLTGGFGGVATWIWDGRSIGRHVPVLCRCVVEIFEKYS